MIDARQYSTNKLRLYFSSLKNTGLSNKTCLVLAKSWEHMRVQLTQQLRPADHSQCHTTVDCVRVFELDFQQRRYIFLTRWIHKQNCVHLAPWESLNNWIEAISPSKNLLSVAPFGAKVWLVWYFKCLLFKFFFENK